MPKCLGKITTMHAQVVDHSCRLTFVLVVFYRPPSLQRTINSGPNAPCLLENHNKPINTHCAYNNHETKVANGEKACLQHTRFLHYYEKCVKKADFACCF